MTLVTVPPGCQVTVSVPGGTIYVGGTGVTSTQAPPLPARPDRQPGQRLGDVLFAIAAAGTVAAGVILSTPR